MNDTTFQGDGKLAYVPVVVNTKLTKQSNADRIRSMTDEELAKLIHDIVQAEMWRVQVRECITTDAGWLDWLKQEANDAL